MYKENPLLDFFNAYDKQVMKKYMIHKSQENEPYHLLTSRVIPTTGQLLSFKFCDQLITSSFLDQHVVVVKLRQDRADYYYVTEENKTYKLSGVFGTFNYSNEAGAYCWVFLFPESFVIMCNLMNNIQFTAKLLGETFDKLYDLHKKTPFTKNTDKELDRTFTMKSILSCLSFLYREGGYKSRHFTEGN